MEVSEIPKQEKFVHHVKEIRYMGHVLLVHSCMGTHLYNSDAWGPKAKETIVIFWKEREKNESHHTIPVLLQCNPFHPAVCKKPGWPMLHIKHQPLSVPGQRITSLWAKRL